MADPIHKMRLVIQLIAALFVLVGIVTVIWGVATPNWQTVFINNLNEKHQHGLWLDCIDFLNQRAYSCIYKFNNAAASGQNFVNTNNLFPGSPLSRLRHTYEAWQRSTLILLSVSVAAALIGLAFAIGSCWHRIPAIVWTVLQFIATILCLAGILVYFSNYYSNDLHDRGVPGVINQQWHGYSFWLCIAGLCCFAVATFLSILTTVLIVRRHKRIQKYQARTDPRRRPPVQIRHSYPTSSVHV